MKSQEILPLKKRLTAQQKMQLGGFSHARGYDYFAGGPSINEILLKYDIALKAAEEELQRVNEALLFNSMP